MGTFSRIVDSIDNPQAHQQRRLEVMRKIEAITGRRLMVYVSSLSRSVPGASNAIEPEDKAGFSDMIEGWTGEKVDIFLHSPGGSAEATEMIVKMLHANFADIRFIVPHSAKSAATMLALSGSAILMDERSELGPIDPQVPMPLPNGRIMFVPAQTVLDGFERAREILSLDPSAVPAFVPMLNKYDLHLLQICENAKTLAKNLVAGWIQTYMFGDSAEGAAVASRVADKLGEHSVYLSHARGIDIEEAKSLGLKVIDLRDTPDLRSLVWELYCLAEFLFERTPLLIKLFERSDGTTLMRVGGIPVESPIARDEVATAGPEVAGRPTPMRGKKRHNRR